MALAGARVKRRGFLQLLGLAAAGVLAPALTLDPERALWVPGAKTIFDFGGIRPANLDRLDILLTPDWVTREALAVLKDSLLLSKVVNRRYEERFGPAAVGYTVNVRRPDRFIDGRPTVVLRPGEDFITIQRTT